MRGPDVESRVRESDTRLPQACSCSAVMARSRGLLHLERFAEFMAYGATRRVGKRAALSWTRGSRPAIGERSLKARSRKSFLKTVLLPSRRAQANAYTRSEPLPLLFFLFLFLGFIREPTRHSELSGATIYEFQPGEGKIKIYTRFGIVFLLHYTASRVLINFPVPQTAFPWEANRYHKRRLNRVLGTNVVI